MNRNGMMKYTLLLLLLFFTAFTACKEKGTNHLPPKVMQQLLADISIAEAYSTMAKDSLHKGGTKNYDSLTVWYKEVLAHYKLTQEQLTESLNWYKSHPTELDSVYTSTLTTVTGLQSKAGNP